MCACFYNHACAESCGGQKVLKSSMWRSHLFTPLLFKEIIKPLGPTMRTTDRGKNKHTLELKHLIGIYYQYITSQLCLFQVKNEKEFIFI